MRRRPAGQRQDLLFTVARPQNAVLIAFRRKKVRRTQRIAPSAGNFLASKGDEHSVLWACRSAKQGPGVGQLDGGA